MPTESAITATIIRHLDKLGVFWLKLHGSSYQRRGMPDLLVVLEGLAYFFEVKTLGNKPTQLQSHRMSLIRQAGAVAEVVCSWADVRRVLDKQTAIGG